MIYNNYNPPPLVANKHLILRYASLHNIIVAKQKRLVVQKKTEINTYY